jgi:hypothetical protein
VASIYIFKIPDKRGFFVAEVIISYCTVLVLKATVSEATERSATVACLSHPWSLKNVADNKTGRSAGELQAFRDQMRHSMRYWDVSYVPVRTG